jgi:primosomal protein N' (replication factor Y)
VLRLAVPKRHAATEKRSFPDLTPVAGGDWSPGWDAYEGGPDLVSSISRGELRRVVWSALPGDDPMLLLARAAAAAAAAGRGALLCVPDHRDVARLSAALDQVVGADRHVVLTADLGPSTRYGAFLRVLRGQARIAIGTRAAAFAPVQDLGLLAIWDDGDDLYAEPRAPYPHTREVLLQRSLDEDVTVVVGGFARTVEAAHLVSTGWASQVVGARDTVRHRAPRVSVSGATDAELARDPFARAARIPSVVHAVIGEGLAHGPVLVQTPRLGYVPGLVCETCRAPARCPRCSGPLRSLGGHRPPACSWCGDEADGWACASCGGRGLRAVVVGEERTAEELGRAFPRHQVIRSSGARVLDVVADRPALVIATPGAEPLAAAGYAAVVILDTWLPLSRPSLRSAEEALRRWFNAAALARPVEGRVAVVGEASLAVIQALVRWDPAGFASREAEERISAHLPPASRVALVSGAQAAVVEAIADLDLPPGAEVLGPVEGEPGQTRVVVRAPRRYGPQLSRVLVEMQGVRAAKRRTSVRVQVDPPDLT